MRWKWIPIIFVSIVTIAVVAVVVLLSRYDYNKLKPRIERAAYEATGRELKLGGDIELEIGFTPSLVVEDVSLQNVKWGSGPNVVSVKRFEVQVALLPLLGGNIDVKRLVLVEPDILIETDRTGRSNLEFRPPEISKAEAKKEKELVPGGEPKLPAFMVGEMLVLDGRLTYRDGKSGKTTSVKLDRLRVLGTSAKSAISFDLKGSLDDTSFGVSGKLASLARLADPSLGPVKITALNISLGQNKITGSVEADISSKRPRAKLLLASENLDLRDLFDKESSGGDEKSAKKATKKKKVFSSEPIQVESLKAVDMELSLKIKKLILPALAMNDFDLDMKLKNGRLKIAPLKAGVGGGVLDVNLQIRPKGKAVKLDARVKVAGLDLALMGRELKITEALSGKIDADLNVKGSGASIAAIMASLNGEKKIVMGRGRIDNKYLKFLGGDLGSNLLSLFNPLAAKEDFTVVNCMVVDFGITNGVARSRAMVFDTSYMSVVGEGRVDFKTEKLDISLNPQPKKGLGGGGLGKLTLSLSELASAFRLGGTLANPALTVDTTRAALTIGKIGGGKALFGPTDQTASLEGTSKGDENPCLTAIEVSKKSAAAPAPAEKKGADKPSLSIPEDLKEVGEEFMKLFGQ